MSTAKFNLGFTLIELLIVLFIMSIVASVAVMSVKRNENKEIESFARELMQTMTLAEEQAMLQPAIIGLMIDTHGFQFARYQASIDTKKIETIKNNWELLSDSNLSFHQIPDDIFLDISVGNEKLSSLTGNNNVNNNFNNKAPQIIFSTNGEVTPFTIYLGKSGKKPHEMIIGHADGGITNQLLS